ncbi:MAG: cytochrome c biogenesis protein CcdA [Acidimicrobiia bacterium]
MEITEVNALAYLAAFGGGIISFLSPCVLPLVPGYLSIVTGLDVAEIQDGGRDTMMRITRDTGLFVLGFTVVFVLLGVSASTAGSFFLDNQALLTRISGVIILAMSLFMLGSLFLQAPWLYQEKRFQPDTGRLGAFAPPVTGAAFGFGWTPCIGPVLGSILAIAATQGRAWAGGSLLFVYSLGLGIPFLVTGLAFGRMAGTLAWVKQHFTTIVAVSATLLAVFGILLIFDSLSWVSSQLIEIMDSLGLERVTRIG